MRTSTFTSRFRKDTGHERGPTKRVDYREHGALTDLRANSIFLVLSISLMMGICSGVTNVEQSRHGRHIRCVQGGVELTAVDRIPYVVCAENYCAHYALPDVVELVRFPPQITLHEHDVQWKFLENSSLVAIETTCPPAPFCDNVDCTFCSALIFNPECWPVGAIGVTALLLYFIITGCYVFLYVPLTMGKPVRILLTCMQYAFGWLSRMAWRALCRFRRRRTKDLLELLAIVLGLASLVCTVNGCQEINIFSHRNTVCSTSEDKQLCKVHNQKKKYVAHMIPSVPVKWGAFSFSLSSLTLPPTPALNTHFIADNNETALWDSSLVPALFCQNSSAAEKLQCEVREECACYPAELKVNCKCKGVDIAEWFRNLQHRFPVVTPALTFRRNQEGLVQASISTMVMAEIVINIQDEFETSLLVDEAICTVPNTKFDRIKYAFSRMAAQDVDDDTKYWSTFMVKQHYRWEAIKSDLDAMSEAFQQQISIASMIQLQWSYTQTEESFVLGTPAHKIRTVSKVMKDLILTRERISRMGVRFVCTLRFYKDQIFIGKPKKPKEEWESEAEAALLQLDKNVKRFSAVIKEMEREMEQAEKDFNVGPCHTNAQHINTLFRRAFDNLTATDKDSAEKRFETLQQKLDEQSEEISRLKKALEPKQNTAEDVEMTDDAYWSRMVEEVHDVDEANQVQTSPPELVSEGPDEEEELDFRSAAGDEEEAMKKEDQLKVVCDEKGERVVERVQADRVVERVSEGRHEDRRQVQADRVVERVSEGRHEDRRQVQADRVVERVSEDRHEDHREAPRRDERELEKLIQDVQKKIDHMERALKTFPYRKRETFSPGVKRTTKCCFCGVVGRHFSDSCPTITDGQERWELMLEKVFLPILSEPMWNRVKGTPFEFVIPSEHHHTALCRVPDRRGRARSRIEEAREELRQLLGELALATVLRRREQEKRQEGGETRWKEVRETGVWAQFGLR
ncbi:hypothetical protein OSTOST_15939 [Ostertagia ostertagi]